MLLRPTSRRVLIACYETPGFGGASTATYELFAWLQRDGIDVSLVSLVDQWNEPFLRATFGPTFGNPRALDNVHTHRLSARFHDPDPALSRFVAGQAPDVILAVGYIAALAVGNAAPDIPLIFYTVGCDQAIAYLPAHGDAQGICSALRVINRPHLYNREEMQAVERADLIIAHAPLVQELFEHFYPSALGRMYPDVLWMSEWIIADATRHANIARPFAERDIDVLFVASRWDRVEKNLPLVREIVRGVPDLRVHMVGSVDPPIGATVHGIITARDTLFALMARTRVLVCPSVIDAAPGAIFEAVTLGCNVIASRNCGNVDVCHPALVAEPFRADIFADRVRSAVARPYAQNLARFTSTGAYQTLGDILAVV